MRKINEQGTSQGVNMNISDDDTKDANLVIVDGQVTRWASMPMETLYTFWVGGFSGCFSWVCYSPR